MGLPSDCPHHILFIRIKQTPLELRIYVEAAESPGDREPDCSSVQLEKPEVFFLDCTQLPQLQPGQKRDWCRFP
jgi:hypothetical protein